MKRSHLADFKPLAVGFVLACGPSDGRDSDAFPTTGSAGPTTNDPTGEDNGVEGTGVSPSTTDSGMSGEAESGMGSGMDSTTGMADSDEGTTTIKFDQSNMTTTTGSSCGDLQCPAKIDLLFVIDNSGSMGEEQLNLAKNFPLLIDRLKGLKDSSGNPANADINIMVTTTDFGNPQCTPFQTHPPEKGAPINTGCNARIGRFTGLGMAPETHPEACTDVCPTDVVPMDPHLHFDASGASNVVGGGDPADALSCIGPQGIDGCGYESQLECMLQALNPGKPWNTSATPFLRDDAKILGVVQVTDEEDCSIQNFSVMSNATFMEPDPSDGNALKPSSAICWNAGTTCTGPDANGVYSSCVGDDHGMMQPLSRYIDYLLSLNSGERKVIMLGILGVPEVTEHNPDPPYQPTAGGVLSLVYRDWKDGAYPAGDILPSEAPGTTAAHKSFSFGIGPGCTGEDGMGGFTGQAIPPVRIKEVCEALNIEDDPATLADETSIRCCIESICSQDFSPAVECLAGILEKELPAG